MLYAPASLSSHLSALLLHPRLSLSLSHFPRTLRYSAASSASASPRVALFSSAALALLLQRGTCLYPPILSRRASLILAIINSPLIFSRGVSLITRARLAFSSFRSAWCVPCRAMRRRCGCAIRFFSPDDPSLSLRAMNCRSVLARYVPRAASISRPVYLFSSVRRVTCACRAIWRVLIAAAGGRVWSARLQKETTRREVIAPETQLGYAARRGPIVFAEYAFEGREITRRSTLG